jgi:acyl carrier protein
VAWGAWAGAGMATGIDFAGLAPLDPAQATAALHRALDRGETTLVVADVDWKNRTRAFPGSRSFPLLAEIAAAAPEAPVPPVREDTYAHLTPVARHRVLLKLVSEHVAAVAGYLGADQIDPDRAFRETGFDSLAAVQLRNRLDAELGLGLPTSLVFDHPTPRELAGWLAGKLADGEAGVLAELDRIEKTMSCLSPEEADRAGVVARLEALLSSARKLVGADDAIEEMLDSAGAEEVFDFIDREIP